MKILNLCLSIVWLVAGYSIESHHTASAATVYLEPFTGNTSPGWSFAGTAESTMPYLTAGILDPPGDGWLRICESEDWQSTIAYCNVVVPSFHATTSEKTTVTVSFDFTIYNQASFDGDGFTFFFFDGSVRTPTPGAVGGALGYAQRNIAPPNDLYNRDGIPGGYIGVGFDVYGGFSYAGEGRTGGAANWTPNAVTVRGGGDGQQGFTFLTASSVGLFGGLDNPNTSVRPDQSGVQFRRATIILDKNDMLTVLIQFGDSSTPIIVLNAFDLSTAFGQVARPATLGFGFSAGTGLAQDTIEVRNLRVESDASVFTEPGGALKTIGNTAPVLPTFPTGLPQRQPGKTNLVIVTHGWNKKESGQTYPPDVIWVDSMVSAISNNVAKAGLTNWQVVGYKWITNAWVGTISGIAGGTLLDNADKEGANLGKCISTQGWSHVHLIGHSAGAAVIQVASRWLVTNSSKTEIHTTLLDPYVGLGKYHGRDKYGEGSTWADSYFSRDKETGFETEGPLDHAYNVDVTWLDPDRKTNQVFYSLSYPPVQSCWQVESTHAWPHNFYMKTVPTASIIGSDGFGFPVSKEGRNWSHATSTYHVGKNTMTNLGVPDSCVLVETTSSTPLFTLPALNIGSTPQVTFGSVQNNGEGTTIHSGSPAWLALILSFTNSVNFVSFDARFLSATGSIGLLTVFWDTNIVGTVGERAVLPGLQHYMLPLPRADANSAHVLGLRIDPFTSTQSVVTVTNVVAGFSGVRDTFSLCATTNTYGGLRVWQLNGLSGFNYSVESSTNLIDWQAFALLVNTNGIVNFVDPSATNNTPRFYRAVAPIE